ncbi:hypothetical protein AC578_9100 [Pseudocercospora eumusae]|uniref:Uncharacterized protein n=1 Tax=Pseudocercospora eumusae TaxID=321146 RepID=A0A139HV91_9PEZI|nr:hypothetical protein AC578_9100 [Pseudocercospora eumusae]
MAGLLNGVAGGLTSGDGPLGAASGLTDGLTGGGLGDTLGGVSGIAGGLLGSGEGLNVAGLVGLGSDDPALLDLNPSEKKPVKAQKAAIAKKNEMKRQAEMKKLQDQVRQQGGKATPEQQAYAKQLQESQARENEEMAKLDRMLGPTDPELFQQAMASENSAVPGGNAGSSSEGLFYAYLVDGQTAQPTHVMTFANAAAANAWYQSASQTSRVEKVSPQMYMYEGGTPPRPGRRMACMPIQTVQPIIPLQHSNGYPICCKDRGGSSGGSSSGNGAPAAPAKPPRKKQDAAEQHATNVQAAGDTRPRDQIVQEAMQDLKDQCAASHASGGNSGPTSTGATNGLAPAPLGGSWSGPVDSLTSNPLGATNVLGAGPLGGDSGGGDGGLLDGLGGGLLGGSEGLNVAGLLAIGSDEKALLDLNPAQKKEEKLKRAKELKRQSDLQARQKKELEDAVKRQNGQATPEQRKQYEELNKRQAATGQAANALNESIKKDDEDAKKGLTGGLPGPVGGVADGLPTKGLTDGLPTSGLTEGLPTGAATGAVSGVAGGLPTGGLTKGIGL